MKSLRRRRLVRTRRLFLEPLEKRYTLNADVDSSGMVVPLDALLVANALNQPGEFPFTPALDVNRDGSLTTADFDAVAAVLNGDAGDGSAGGGSDVSEFQAEGEGSESGSGGGGGTPVVSMSVSGSSVNEDGETSETITLYRTGPVTSTLDVSLYSFGVGDDPADANDYQLLLNGTPVGASVTFPIGESSIELTVKAVDDTTEENDELRDIGIAEATGTPAAYTRHEYAYHQVFTIEDDEWRWVYAMTDDYEFEWDPPPTAIVIPGTFDGALYPHGDALVGLDSIGISQWAKAVYFYEYTATTTGGDIEFTCHAQTGAITQTGVPGAAALVDNHEWVSAALKYTYDIEDDSGDIHTVDVTTQFLAGAGGTYAATPTAGANSGASNTVWTKVEDWGIQAIAGEHSATLRCSKGPDDYEPPE